MNIPVKTEFLEEFRRLTYKLLNKHLHYIKDNGEVDLSKVLADYERLTKIIAMSNPNDEIRNYRIILALSMAFNLLTVLGLSFGYLVLQ